MPRGRDCEEEGAQGDGATPRLERRRKMRDSGGGRGGGGGDGKGKERRGALRFHVFPYAWFAYVKLHPESFPLMKVYIN